MENIILCNCYSHRMQLLMYMQGQVASQTIFTVSAAPIASRGRVIDWRANILHRSPGVYNFLSREYVLSPFAIQG